jgi:hypothetical protein
MVCNIPEELQSSQTWFTTTKICNSIKYRYSSVHQTDKPPVSNFMKIHPVGAHLFHANGWMDGHMKGWRDIKLQTWLKKDLLAA